MSNTLSHTKRNCKYHIIFIPKYRRKVIYNKLRTNIRGYIQNLYRWKGVEIVEVHLMPDYLYLLLSISLKINRSSFMRYLKVKS